MHAGPGGNGRPKHFFERRNARADRGRQFFGTRDGLTCCVPYVDGNTARCCTVPIIFVQKLLGFISPVSHVTGGLCRVDGT
jgi:hypothetical protein